jgi:FMN phosphatase YigB (HAD superfamily)
VIIFDLDGTLSDHSPRLGLIDHSAPDSAAKWDEYTRAAIHDKPIQPIVHLLRILYDARGYRIEIWTGRNESVRKEAIEWLDTQVFLPWRDFWKTPEHPRFVRLRMRRAGDHVTSDPDLKEGWYEEVLRCGDRVDFVIEDRQRVVEMWRRRRVMCLQPAEGNY